MTLACLLLITHPCPSQVNCHGYLPQYVVLKMCTEPCMRNPHSKCCYVSQQVAPLFACCRQLQCCKDQQHKPMAIAPPQATVRSLGSCSLTITLNSWYSAVFRVPDSYFPILLQVLLGFKSVLYYYRTNTAPNCTNEGFTAIRDRADQDSDVVPTARPYLERAPPCIAYYHKAESP